MHTLARLVSQMVGRPVAAGRYDGQARERFCYQLVEGASEYQIAVLTPMG